MPAFPCPRLFAALVLLAALLLASVPALAQDSPAAQVEALALQAHLQNLRTGNKTLWLGGQLGNPRQMPPLSALGDRFDPFVLPGLGESDEFSSQHLTRPVLLNFWASWCPPCRIEFPHLAQVALAPDAHAYDVVFVNMSDTEAAALDFLRDQPPGLQAVVDVADRLSRRARVVTIPTSLLLDTDGTVLVVHIGVVTPTVSAFLDGVAAHPGEGSFDASAYADVEPGANLLPVDVAGAPAIAFGQRVLGALTDQEFQHAYRFEGRAGQRVAVSLTADSPDLDPYVVLLTAAGERLAENDDAGGTRDSALEVALPADGTYIVVATRFLEAEGYSTGEYSLTVRLVDGEGEQTAREGFITIGSTVVGRVSGINPRAIYAFEGRAGDVITLWVTHVPGDVALQVELKGPNLQRLAVSEPSQGGEASLVDFVLPQDGIYRVTVFRPRSRETENLAYTLSLSAAN